MQNPNELVFLDLTQPPATATVVAHTLHSFGGRPERLTFTRRWRCRAAPRRLLIVESDQDLSILDLADPSNEISVPLTSGTDSRRLAPAGDHRRRRRSGAATTTRASACGCRTTPASSR